MNLRQLLLKKFLPFVLLFMTLSVLSLNQNVQKLYYPAFSAFTIGALNNTIEDTYFKDKPKGANTDLDYNTIGVLFQSKKKLMAVMEAAKRNNTQGQYDYKGFLITVDETFVAPLTFFICLLLFSPGSIKNKLIAFVIGTALIMGFAYLIVYFKGLFMVSKSGVRDMLYDENSLEFFKLLHFLFSSVTIVTVVLFTWILVTFRKSDLKRVFS